MTSIARAISALKYGKPIVIVDGPERENEGDIVAAAQYTTPQLINFMITEGRGLVCAPISEERADILRLKPMIEPQRNLEAHRCNFTVSVDAADGISTGISAHDRARTVQLLANHDTQSRDLVRPGHIFPLIARSGGVLVRPGHTEATIDLLLLAGLAPAGVLCEILNPSGTMARKTELTRFAETHGLPLITIRELIEYRSTSTHERAVYTSRES